jgi:RNA polymerase sigma-70 factor (ECF subfamily)
MDVTLAEFTGSVAAPALSRMPNAPADADCTRLVLEARAGDTDAFCALIELHQRAARRIAMAALGSDAEADEAVQDACVTAWQRITSLDDPGAFRAWLLRITWRKALDRRRSIVKWLRRTVRRRQGESTEASTRFRGRGASDRDDVDSLIAGVADAATPIDDELAARERDRVVAQLIRSLPARLRDPFLLAAAGEHRYDEIATMLEIPVGTVKWRVSEARRVLREKLVRVGFGREGGPARPQERS